MAQTESMRFPGSDGNELAGVLHVPDGSPLGSVLLAHCFTCSKDLHTMSRLADGLADVGHEVLRFDFAAVGESEGEFVDKTVTNNVRDLVAAATALIRRGSAPCAMVGHSLGGAATLLAAEQLKTVRTVAVIGAPSAPSHVGHLFASDEEEIRRTGSATVQIANRAFEVSSDFLDDLEKHDQAGQVATLDRPLLVVHAVDDEVVHVTEGERIFHIARQPKAFLPLLGTDHLVTSRRAAERLSQILVDWLAETL